MNRKPDIGCLVIDSSLHGKDMKNYRARKELEEVIVTRNSTWLIIALLVALLSWMTARDNHPFNDEQVYELEERS